MSLVLLGGTVIGQQLLLNSSKGTVFFPKAKRALGVFLRLYVGMMTLALGSIPTPHCLPSWSYPKAG